MPKRTAFVGVAHTGRKRGMAYAKFGSKVTVIKATPGLLPGFDPELVKTINIAVKKRGIEVVTEAKAKGYTKGANGLTVEYDWSSKVAKLECDQILVTVGLRPSASELDIAQAGVTLNAKGFIPVAKQRRPHVAPIFAVGDLAGQPILAH